MTHIAEIRARRSGLLVGQLATTTSRGAQTETGCSPAFVLQSPEELFYAEELLLSGGARGRHGNHEARNNVAINDVINGAKPRPGESQVRGPALFPLVSHGRRIER